MNNIEKFKFKRLIKKLETGLFGSNLYIVSDRTTEGTQFVRGFGGFVGTLKYKLNLNVEEVEIIECETEEKKEHFEEFDFM